VPSRWRDAKWLVLREAAVILDIIIVASALVALLGLVDFFLVERQKIWLETRAITAWNEIDEMTRFPLTEWWRKGRLWQWAITLLCCAVFAYGWALRIQAVKTQYRDRHGWRLRL
jgi:hypothetical protein